MATNETPFNMSFEDLIKSVSGAGASAGQETAGEAASVETGGAVFTGESNGTIPMNVPEAAGNAVPVDTQGDNGSESTMSFDDMLAQAMSGASAPATPETKAEKSSDSEQEVSVEKPANSGQEEKAGISGGELTFDEMIARAQAAAAVSTQAAIPETTDGTEKEDTVSDPSEESDEKADTGTAVNTSEESPTAEESPDADEKPTEGEEKTGEENSKPEQQKQKRKRNRKKKADVAEVKTEQPAEVPEDTTEEFRVDVFGDDDKVKEQKETTASGISGMEVLFSPEEVAAIRADIRAFVRKELKMAVVDAMKELLNDFNR